MNKFITRLKEEPTLLVQIFQVALALLVSFNLIGFTEAQTGAVLAVVAAVSGVIIGLSVRPFSWALVTGAVQAVIVLIAEFGVELDDDQVGAVYLAVALIGILLRQFVTPEIKLPPGNGTVTVQRSVE